MAKIIESTKGLINQLENFAKLAQRESEAKQIIGFHEEALQNTVNQKKYLEKEIGEIKSNYPKSNYDELIKSSREGAQTVSRIGFCELEKPEHNTQTLINIVYNNKYISDNHIEFEGGNAYCFGAMTEIDQKGCYLKYLLNGASKAIILKKLEDLLLEVTITGKITPKLNLKSIFNPGKYEICLALLEELDVIKGHVVQVSEGRAGRLYAAIEAIKTTPGMLSIDKPTYKKLIEYFNSYLGTKYSVKELPRKSKEYNNNLPIAKEFLKKIR